jgi:hypothetical protein
LTHIDVATQRRQDPTPFADFGTRYVEELTDIEPDSRGVD